jgi:hypothetical protein
LTKINTIQTRNLNIDPQWYMHSIGLNRLSGKPMGMKTWIDAMKLRFPSIKIGYFNPTMATQRKT